ncbi:MAG: Ig-like domain-containing protein [Clostridia bacterium]|nr:Ig-like domain-containing protein [Clostridia bacterium]
MGDRVRLKKPVSILTAVMLCMSAFAGCGAPQTASGSKISLDDEEYRLIQDGDNYKVEIPDGRPRVPQVLCEDADEVYQAYFSDGQSAAEAVVKTGEDVCKIEFHKNPELGFVLQYDDRYVFKPKTFKATYFTSSNPEVATVDENGLITIVGVSDESVVITAGSGMAEEYMTITKTVRAPINVYLLTGQSNAAYFYAEPENATITKQGTSYQYDTVEGGCRVRSLNKPDGSMLVGSIEASLCKTLYDIMGEKTLIINAGISGQPIRTFKPFDADSFIQVNTIWQTSTAEVASEEFSSHFEPRFRSYIWIQGETDDWTNSDRYKSDFLQLHKVFRSPDYFNLDYCFMVMVRSVFTRPCEAQEELAQGYEDIIMASRASQYLTMENGGLRHDNLHYAQAGDNILGEDAAKVIADVYMYGLDSVPEGE